MKSHGLYQLLFAVFICSTITQLHAADDKAAREACIVEAKLTATDANQVRGAAVISKLIQNDSEALKCFQLCYYKKLGLIDSAGKTNAANTLAYMSQVSGISDTNKLATALGTCESVKGSSGCDRLYQFEKCALAKLGV
ncbi:PREDICTED: general odorant-binding protein 56a [Bactrocera latifrons]|uniref:general odorant-binding protein 56a n=1 Tax=Bactrocera latifrons TaxID=174628 RepID=UPI0008DCF722|nr:PREDICTED: general odorant-binding protein 56a [Bactrocera latifrons]